MFVRLCKYYHDKEISKAAIGCSGFLGLNTLVKEIDLCSPLAEKDVLLTLIFTDISLEENQLGVL